MLSREEMIAICRNNDATYNGIFFLAVKSTSIYCLPSCPARFPLEKNIEFYKTRKRAEASGYRGCLRCYSAEYQFQPIWLINLVEYLHNHVDCKIALTDLEKETGKHRSTISSYFQDAYGLTAVEYIRQLKLKTARYRILQGENYRDVAYSLGYESISGFRSAFKLQFDSTPGRLIQELR